jgi:dethiobiotin synthetase
MKRVRGVFITGTDTGVGKTAVACGFAAWCHRQGIDVGVMKPIATGGRWRIVDGRRRLVSDDAVRLAAAADANDPWSLINPVCYKEPLAPWTAARRTGRPVNVRVVAAAFRTLARQHAFVVVEGIGGLLVPLTARLTVVDLIHRLGLPVIIVARPGLGTLNHTLLSLQCAKAAGLSVIGVVLNAHAPPPRDPLARLAEATNPDVLARVGRVPILGQLPFDSRVAARDANQTCLAQWFSRHVDSPRGLW